MKYIDLRERTKEDILQIVMEKNIEIKRLNNIIKEVREYIEKTTDSSQTSLNYGMIRFVKEELLEILDK